MYLTVLIKTSSYTVFWNVTPKCVEENFKIQYLELKLLRNNVAFF